MGWSMLTRLPSVSRNETYCPTPGIAIGSPSTSPPISLSSDTQAAEFTLRGAVGYPPERISPRSAASRDPFSFREDGIRRALIVLRATLLCAPLSSCWTNGPDPVDPYLE